jgi:hypothetical protein
MAGSEQRPTDDDVEGHGPSHQLDPEAVEEHPADDYPEGWVKQDTEVADED